MKIGWIGCGNMARAMIDGVLRANFARADEIYVSARNMEKLSAFAKPRGLNFTHENIRVAKNAELLVLAVKPNSYMDVIAEISKAIRKETIVVSIAPGKTLARLEEAFGVGVPVKIVRTMPNTPVSVGEGMTGMCFNDRITRADAETVAAFLECFGRAAEVSEEQMDAVVAVSGSSPAYVFLMIEAMADAGVLKGLPREKAYVFAAQAVLGAAKMFLDADSQTDSQIHPGVLKDRVCSPGGTTIEAVRTLEAKGFRSALIEAMIACADKSRSML